MNIIDENIVFSQRQRLTELKIHYKQIGFEIGRLGMKDLNDIIPLLHRGPVIRGVNENIRASFSDLSPVLPV